MLVKRFVSKKTCFLLVVLILFSIVLMGCAQDEEPATEEPKDLDENEIPEVAIDHITIGVSAVGGTWYPMGAAMGEILERELGISYTLFEGGGDANAIAIGTGELEIAITGASTAVMGERGDIAGYEAFDNIVAIASLYPVTTKLIVLKDSNIFSVEDFKGVSTSSGLAGYTSTAIHKELFHDIYGIPEADIQWEYVTFPDAVSLFKDRHLSIFSPQAQDPFPPVQEIAVAPGFRFINIDRDKIAEMSARNPAHIEVTIPAGTYQGQTEDYITLGGKFILIGRRDLPEEFVYTILKTLMDHREELATVHSSLSHFNPEESPLGVGVELHPGAERYFREAGVLK